MKQALKPFGVFLLWNLLIGLPLLLGSPLLALPFFFVLYPALIWGYTLRDPRRGRRRRWADLRLRPLTGDRLRLTLVAVPVLLLLSWALGDVYTRFVPVPVDSLNPFAAELSRPDGRLVISLFAIGIAPIAEEFIFRGMIQSRLERQYGAIGGIAGSAGLFAVVHVLPWVFPLHFFLGIAFGFAVWATRSIWTGVVLHAANNTAAMIGFAVGGEEAPPTGTLWEMGVTPDLWISLLTLALTSAAGVWITRKLLRLRRYPALPTRTEPIYLR